MVVFAETISENDPASLRYQVVLRDDIRKDGRPIAVMTEFTSAQQAAQRSRMYQPLVASVSRREDLRESLKKLCHGLNAREFLHTSQERFVNI